MEKIVIKQETPGNYHLTLNNPEKQSQSIYWGETPTLNITDKTLLFSTKEQEITFNLVSLKRVYFVIVDGNQKSLVGERTLLIDGMNNFRDMGGYATASGQTTKWGMLYRSDQIHNATVKGLEMLRTLGIHTVIDYRSDDEIAKYPNPQVADEKTFILDPKAHTAELSAQFTSSKEKEDELLIAKIIEESMQGNLVNQYDMVTQQYQNFAQKKASQEAFAAMIQATAKKDATAVVQHCRGGKDRTGFGAMLLLGILGVDNQTIIDDYMLTYYNRLARNEFKMNKYRKITQDEKVLDYLYSLIETKPEFIETAMNVIIDNYKSIENYAKVALGITDDEVQLLKSMYLE